MGKVVQRSVMALCIIASCFLAWNIFGVNMKVSSRLAQDERNAKVKLYAYHQHFVVPSVLVMDLRKVDGAAPADVLRALLHSAQALKDQRFDRVMLAFNGKEKFFVLGDYFQKLGEEFGTQNPMYTLRTLPENIYKLDGDKAYGTWTGGWLGVATKQMQDFTQFCKDWFAAEMEP